MDLLEHRKIIQPLIFVALLVLLLGFEKTRPRRAFQFSRIVRIISNISLAVINNFVLQLIFPVLAVGAAYIAVEKGWGLFQMIALPSWLEFIAGVLL
ncbi:MAG: hypothetical protein KDD53_06815, partial [Bdellovibrionales bacterium]|nr:hypothetical protein [Bdellovibrionales bacterium]